MAYSESNGHVTDTLRDPQTRDPLWPLRAQYLENSLLRCCYLATIANYSETVRSAILTTACLLVSLAVCMAF